MLLREAKEMMRKAGFHVVKKDVKPVSEEKQLKESFREFRHNYLNECGCKDCKCTRKDLAKQLRWLIWGRSEAGAEFYDSEVNDIITWALKNGFDYSSNPDDIYRAYSEAHEDATISEALDLDEYEDESELDIDDEDIDDDCDCCDVCAICGQESCDGEYSEDGDFVCSDCTANTEQEMLALDSGSFWDDKIPDTRTPRARQLDDMSDEEDYDEFEESLHSRKCGCKLYETLDDDYVLPEHQKDEPDPSTYRDDLDDVEDWDNCPAYYGKADTLEDEDYIDPDETVEDGLSDEDYIDPETNLDNICPYCGEVIIGKGFRGDDGQLWCSSICCRRAYIQAEKDADDIANSWVDNYHVSESCECGKKGCSCGGKKKSKKAKKSKGWVPYWQYKKNQKEE